MHTTQIQRQHPAHVKQPLELTAPQGQSERYSRSRERAVSRNANEPSTHTQSYVLECLHPAHKLHRFMQPLCY